MVYKELEVKNDEGKVFNVEVYMNGRSIKRIEKEAKEIDPKFNFNSSINAAMSQEFTHLLIVCGSVVHLKGRKEPVGSDWFDDNGFSVFGQSFLDLVAAMGECMKDLYPTKTGK